MKEYFVHGKLVAKQGHRDELANTLLIASKLVAKAKGCKLYIVGLDENDGNSVYVTEIWNTKEDHDNSLKTEDVRALIKKTLPLLNGQPSKGQALEILGGMGL